MRAPRALLILALALMAGPALAQDGDFSGFVASLRSDAEARGIARKTFDAAFAELRGPDPDVLARTRRQGEFSRPVWDYLVGAVSPGRIARGQAQGKRLAATLASIEAKTGVPRAVVLAFWGVESDFGASAGSLPTIRALASLAYARHRGSLFRDELLAALQILENGDVEPARMVGSWAGAMGQVQFLPSVYLREAVDFDGDGRRDIWRSEADSLASIAHYLRSLGWKPGLSWGYEVRLPKDFDLTRYRGPLADFTARGVRRTDGSPLPADGEASLFLPGGLGSPVFLITDNFEVIRGYNTSDSYALAIGHLADRLAGGPALAAPWPSGAARLDGPGLKRLQAALAARGLYAGEQDGRAGPKLREAVRQYQIREGLPADGYARPALLERLEGRP
ncbi:lytic murein transglycosylase [Methylorubrum rhodesianum]|uniref:Lytic murein transglycosylase n=2 Tax=Methylorubrum rhodesianum TaxID=29427 RepID=A0ABU9ZFF5_9HYPH|nr:MULTISPECIES: lytic murein transglycosylase [Methylorubrum]MBB5762755.1 lytic murein transglycosylase [Methylorubrum rhodesianum]MBI1688950.1 lytic murein transglycosylase [Methylorubrum sp. DB1722]